jgi:hypothetical protein
MRFEHLLTAAALTAMAAVTPLDAQKLPPADLAARLSGTWTINPSLSPSLAPRGRSGRTGGPQFAMRPALFQRGGRGGGGGGDTPSSGADLTPAEQAEQVAMRQLRQIAPEITITATPESVSFVDVRGEQACGTNGKGIKLTIADAPVTMKCKWDKELLRQEFATTRTSLIRTWSLDDAGHLVLKARYEGLTQNTPEAVAVFDRKKP